METWVTSDPTETFKRSFKNMCEKCWMQEIQEQKQNIYVKSVQKTRLLGDWEGWRENTDDLCVEDRLCCFNTRTQKGWRGNNTCQSIITLPPCINWSLWSRLKTWEWFVDWKLCADRVECIYVYLFYCATTCARPDCFPCSTWLPGREWNHGEKSSVSFEETTFLVIRSAFVFISISSRLLQIITQLFIFIK